MCVICGKLHETKLRTLDKEAEEAKTYSHSHKITFEAPLTSRVDE